jgi:hypothetical protein
MFVFGSRNGPKDPFAGREEGCLSPESHKGCHAEQTGEPRPYGNRSPQVHSPDESDRGLKYSLWMLIKRAQVKNWIPTDSSAIFPLNLSLLFPNLWVLHEGSGIILIRR